VPTPIEDKYQELLATTLNLGQPQGAEEALYDGGSMQVYEFGRIYLHPRIGTPFECHGLILARYLELSAELGALGYPTSDEVDHPFVTDGKMNSFEWGQIQWDESSGAVETTDSSLPEFAARVVVKLVDGLNIGLGDGEEIDIEALGSLLGPLALTPVFVQLQGLLAGASIRRVFGSIPATDLLAIVSDAQAADSTYEPPDLLSFLEIELPSGVDPDTVASALNAWLGVVEEAYRSAQPSDPTVVGTTNPLFAQQGHLDTGPIGVGAAAAWARGADGTGIRFIDVELGWFLGHEDIQPNAIRLLGGVNVPTSHGHGTAVLGTVIARDNNLGGVGLAPAAQTDLMSWASPGETPGRRNQHTIARRIVEATKILGSGDVLLLEVQLPGRLGGQEVQLPAEKELDIFEAIRLAVAKGIIVVEAAGNGSSDLDNFVDRNGVHRLNRTLPAEFKESGAIIVGASTTPFPHETHSVSNRGSRVDCYAWGDHVVTPGSFDQQDNPFLYFTPPSPDVPDTPFGHTSGASAIIAGLCLLVQHLRSLLPSSDGTTGRLRPERMRALLQSDANGTPSFLAGDKIGPMPDLAKIVANEFVEFL